MQLVEREFDRKLRQTGHQREEMRYKAIKKILLLGDRAIGIVASPSSIE
jgi:hypothetical protein